MRAAEGGIVLLDDVERLKHQHQDQLHQVVVDGRYYTVGTNTETRVNVRFIATTNKPVAACIAEGLLKKDFVSRLRTFELHVPPLAERREDIPLLCQALLRRHLDELIRKGFQPQRDVHFAADCLAFIQQLRFEDNVRSLEWLMVRLIAQIGRDRDTITTADVLAVWPAVDRLLDAEHIDLRSVHAGVDRQHALDALKAENYNMSRAARQLGLTRQGLHKMLKRLGIAKRRPSES